MFELIQGRGGREYGVNFTAFNGRQVDVCSSNCSIDLACDGAVNVAREETDLGPFCRFRGIKYFVVEPIIRLKQDR